MTKAKRNYSLLLLLGLLLGSCSLFEKPEPPVETPIITPVDTIARIQISTNGSQGLLVSPYSITEIGPFSAQFSNEVSQVDSLAPVAEHGHVWSTRSLPDLLSLQADFSQKGTLNKLGLVTTSIEEEIANNQTVPLEPLTKYFVRFYAKNIKGTTYHPTVDSFITPGWEVYNTENSGLIEDDIAELVIVDFDAETDKDIWIIGESRNNLMRLDTDNKEWQIYNAQNSIIPWINYQVIKPYIYQPFNTTSAQSFLMVLGRSQSSAGLGLIDLKNNTWTLARNFSGKVHTFTQIDQFFGYVSYIEEYIRLTVPLEIGSNLVAFSPLAPDALEAETQINHPDFDGEAERAQGRNIIDFSTETILTPNAYFDITSAYSSISINHRTLIRDLLGHQPQSTFTDYLFIPWPVQQSLLGTTTGLYRGNEKKGPFSKVPELEDLHIYDMAIHTGRNLEEFIIYIGTSDGLFVNRNEEWWKMTKENAGLPSSRIKTIAIDYDQQIWVGTDAGVACFVGELEKATRLN